MSLHPTDASDVAHLPYRPCVGVMVLNAAGHVWIGRRIKGKTPTGEVGGWWQMPQGGIDDGEDPGRAALRELHEETGIQAANVKMIGESKSWHTYDLPPELLGVAWKGKYRGQRQKWFALRYDGTGADIQLVPDDPKHKPEFDAWKWVAPNAVVDLIVPFKRDVYRAVMAEFADLVA